MKDEHDHRVKISMPKVGAADAATIIVTTVNPKNTDELFDRLLDKAIKNAQENTL